ncbi:MAG TPA: plastocyanin/azurin family copper-binding protein, partial [Rhodopila sp.]|nr:plastocyanin/azurin family copper-binding protein [Rhodopila sp.]
MMRRRSLVLACTMAGSLVLGGGAPHATERNAADLPDQEVHIDNFSFSPATITVPAGTKVVWVNRDDIPHTVVDAAEPRTFKSRPLDTDDRFVQIFSQPGTY